MQGTYGIVPSRFLSPTSFTPYLYTTVATQHPTQANTVKPEFNSSENSNFEICQKVGLPNNQVEIPTICGQLSMKTSVDTSFTSRESSSKSALDTSLTLKSKRVNSNNTAQPIRQSIITSAPNFNLQPLDASSASEQSTTNISSQNTQHATSTSSSKLQKATNVQPLSRLQLSMGSSSTPSSIRSTSTTSLSKLKATTKMSSLYFQVETNSSLSLKPKRSLDFQPKAQSSSSTQQPFANTSYEQLQPTTIYPSVNLQRQMVSLASSAPEQLVMGAFNSLVQPAIRVSSTAQVQSESNSQNDFSMKTSITVLVLLFLVILYMTN